MTEFVSNERLLWFLQFDTALKSLRSIKLEINLTSQCMHSNFRLFIQNIQVFIVDKK